MFLPPSPYAFIALSAPRTQQRATVTVIIEYETEKGERLERGKGNFNYLFYSLPLPLCLPSCFPPRWHSFVCMRRMVNLIHDLGWERHSLGFEWHRLVAGKTLQTGKLNIDFQIKNNPSNWLIVTPVVVVDVPVPFSVLVKAHDPGSVVAFVDWKRIPRNEFPLSSFYRIGWGAKVNWSCFGGSRIKVKVAWLELSELERDPC